MIGETVAAADVFSELIGKGKVKLPIDGGDVAMAYHSPKFSSHILSAGTLVDETASKSTCTNAGATQLLLT